MPGAANRYAAMVDASLEQMERLFGPMPDDIWVEEAAEQFRFDPRRDLGPNLSALASLVEPTDVVVDVGGGAGRVSLPLALRCRDVLTVEPSDGMAVEYEASRRDAGISNARRVPLNWMDANNVQGDVVVACDVTYFVRDIVPFLQKMHSAARRRVVIAVWSEPPPNRSAGVFGLVYGEEQSLMPGHRELLPVLWDMGILPEVRVLPELPWWEEWHYGTRELAMESLAGHLWAEGEHRERALRSLEERFDQLFAADEEGYRVVWRRPMRELLITWETHRPPA